MALDRVQAIDSRRFPVIVAVSAVAECFHRVVDEVAAKVESNFVAGVDVAHEEYQSVCLVVAVAVVDVSFVWPVALQLEYSEL